MKQKVANVKIIYTVCLLVFFLSACKQEKNSLPQLSGNWTALNIPPGNALLTTGTGFISFSPSAGGASPNRTADSVWYSNDHGVTWNLILGASPIPFTASPATLFTIQVDLMNNLNVVAYSHSDSTFYISHNGGETWSELSHLSHNLDMPFNYIYDTGQISLDSAETFDSILFTKYYTTTFFGVSNNRLFAQRNSPYLNTSTGPTILLKSDDFGNTWDTVFITPRENNQPVEMLGIGNYLYQFNYGQILRSVDNGNTWGVINGASPVTFPAGITSNGDIVALDANNNSIYLSHDSAKTWTLAFHNVYGTLGPVLAFDSVVLAAAYYHSNYYIMCSNPKKINWIAADGSAPPGVVPYAYTNLYVDNTYVYAFITGDGFYRRLRSDFKGL